MGGGNSKCEYARFVKGTKEPGYSEHLCNYVNVDPNFLTASISDDCPTVFHAWEKTCSRLKHNKFLGHRDDKYEGRPYKWMSWSESYDYVNDLARGFKALGMMPDVEAEGKIWNFMGIYAKNRPEWALADLASASIGGTTIAFYDTLGPQAIEFVIS